MLADQAARIAGAQMKKGYNCCQSVIIAAGQTLDIPIAEEVIDAAALFSVGMDRGCTCGALVGMMMSSGLLQKQAEHPMGAKLSGKLHDDFKTEFGSTCCRVIRKKRGALQNIGNRACINLTSQAAAMLVKEWEDTVSNAQHINSDPHAE